MRVRSDLTKKEHTIGNIIINNYDMLMSLTSTSLIKDTMSKLLTEANINTPASARLLYNLSRSRTLINSLEIITNSMLAAKGLAVYK